MSRPYRKSYQSVQKLMRMYCLGKNKKLHTRVHCKTAIVATMITYEAYNTTHNSFMYDCCEHNVAAK